MKAVSVLVLSSCLVFSSVAQDQCGNGDLRLVGGSTPFEGRVEMCWNNEWGTVCNDGLTNTASQVNAAEVICRQLGFSDKDIDSSALITTGTNNRFGAVQNSVPIYIDELSCSGYERGIRDCSRNTINIHNCFHSEDIGITCAPGCQHNNSGIGLVDGKIANTGTTITTEGLISFCYNGSLATLTPTNLTLDTANAICAHLGFSDEGAEVQPAINSDSLGGIGQIFSMDCELQGDKVNLSLCTLSAEGNYDHINDAVLSCERQIDDCEMRSTTEPTHQGSTTQSETVVTGQEAITVNRGESAALGTLVGILLVVLVAVIVGWVVTCVLIKAKMKRDYNTLIPKAHQRTLSNETENDREFQNPVYGDGSKPVNLFASVKDSCSIDPLQESDELIYNESYGTVHQYEETEDSQHKRDEREPHHYSYVSPDNFQIDDDYSEPLSPLSSADNLLYEMTDASSEATRELKPDEYSELDQESGAKEEPVESRPRKNKPDIYSIDEYSTLER